MASRSRTSSCTSSASCMRLWWLLAILSSACGKKNPIAELTEAPGEVERQEAEGPWKRAEQGTLYFLQDGAHTKDGSATLGVAAGRARVVMRAGTYVRFRGTPDKIKLLVDGEIDVTGDHRYMLGLGDGMSQDEPVHIS